MEKTIRMPKALLDKWLAALRSGEYKQCKSKLTDGQGFCCLGVLVDTAGGRADEEDYGGYPNHEWLQKNNVAFHTSGGMSPSCNPWLPSLSSFAGLANDDGKTFAEIADAIEACAEGF